MEKRKAEAVMEAILFTMGESVEIARLAETIEESVKDTKAILSKMKERYEQENRGITLIELEESVQLCTKPEMYEYLIKIAKTPKKYVLTDTLMETLSIIAYKQPVTRLGPSGSQALGHPGTSGAVEELRTKWRHGSLALGQG